jgi:deoxyribodipyrimidine photo-lyase
MCKTIFWFRRDLRFDDNTGLLKALTNNKDVLPVFIFDTNILKELPVDDARVYFIYQRLKFLNDELLLHGSSLLVLKGDPVKVWEKLVQQFDLVKVYANKDYEPYARERDLRVKEILEDKNIAFLQSKDQVIFEENDIVKDDGFPYHVFTPYKRKWLAKYKGASEAGPIQFGSFCKKISPFPSLKEVGFKTPLQKVLDFDLSRIDHYEEERNFPGKNGSTHLGPHLRFGTVSVRQIIRQLKPANQAFLNELIWREFFMQILYHYPRVVHQNFKSKYDGIQWLNKSEDFEKWCSGNTGYPMVDAGMRELNTTGYMHNRVRMVTAGFLCKHLLIDWRWGEAYFALKLLDFELSSNNGNWQWAAGTGCDAAPYFRIFNPMEQLKKFDNDQGYVKKWIPELGMASYPDPMVDHKMARERALLVYKQGLSL